jgi:hypothetical protein
MDDAHHNFATARKEQRAVTTIGQAVWTGQCLLLEANGCTHLDAWLSRPDDVARETAE